VTFNFTKNATCVESITFRSTKTVGKTTAIVEELKNKSSLVSELPEGIVYKSFIHGSETVVMVTQRVLRMHPSILKSIPHGYTRIV